MREYSNNPFIEKSRTNKVKNITLRNIENFNDRKMLNCLLCGSIEEKEKLFKFSGREINKNEQIYLRIEVENELFVKKKFFENNFLD